MFDNLKNLSSLMGNAKELREKFEQIQADLAKKTVEGESGAGAVRAVVNGKFDVVSIRLDKSMLMSLAQTGEEGLADQEMIEELITSAVNGAMEKARQMVKQEMGALTGGLSLPGLDGLMG